ncbi:putative diacylglycerol O-acyltransferase tgs1 [Marasmius crinis-equi]|uniref:Trimethylguanosine synthase n=1 Tax=Marasmius crinis-equi TaxID=585013 RepID=A0ABR3F1Z5_9AGAR
MGKKRAGFSGLGRFVQSLQDPVQHSESNPHERPSQPQDRPAKKRKISETPAEDVASLTWVKKYDMTGLVPHYTSPEEVPEALRKYFFQRTRFFSLYSTPPGCLMDEEGWYSVTPELIADQIAERCRCDTILDAFCGVGGNAIAFAKTCQRVIALDTSPTRLALARHNAQIYGVAHHIEFILSDYITFAKSYTSRSSANSKRKIDVVFLSPPWGGPSYISNTPPNENGPKEVVEADTDTDTHPAYSLSSIQPIHGAELFNLSRRITPNIAYYLPRNTDLSEVGALLEDPKNLVGDVKEYVEVEEEWMGNKLKALTCYFGGLVTGQEELFE